MIFSISHVLINIHCVSHTCHVALFKYHAWSFVAVVVSRLIFCSCWSIKLVIVNRFLYHTQVTVSTRIVKIRSLESVIRRTILFVKCDTTDGNFSQMWYSTSDADLGVTEKPNYYSKCVNKTVKRDKMWYFNSENSECDQKDAQKLSVVIWKTKQLASIGSSYGLLYHDIFDNVPLRNWNSK